MKVTLLKGLVVLVPTCVLFSGSVALFLRGKTVWSFFQLFGAGCLVVVALAHVAEALHVFPWMHWGLEDSFGHYLDVSSAVLGVTLFPIGYLLHALSVTSNDARPPRL
jgi:Ca2+/Na+ antiporter